MKKALVIDIGGTKIYSTIINKSGEIISEIEKYSTPKNFIEIKTTLENIVKKHENDVDVIGIATCGAVNNENTGILGSTGNIAPEYPTMNFQALSTKPVFVENDANAAAWAEHQIGASKGMPYSIMLTFGTGVGGGIILNNKLYKGKSGAAGEMHFKLYPDKRRKCTCGSWDCFEAYTSGTGLKITAQEMTNNPEITTYDVFENNMNDIIERWQNDVLAGLIGLANLFDPDIFVLSGSLGQFLDVEFLEQEINKEIVTQPVKVRHATAGNYSGMIGAGLLALEALKNG